MTLFNAQYILGNHNAACFLGILKVNSSQVEIEFFMSIIIKQNMDSLLPLKFRELNHLSNNINTSTYDRFGMLIQF